MSPKVLWDVVRAAATRARIDKLAPHDLWVRALVSAIRPAATWIKSNACWATSPSRRRSSIWAASRGSGTP